MQRIKFFILSILSGVLLSLAWTQWMTGLILIVAFVPLLIVEYHFWENRNNHKSHIVFWYSYLAFLIWNGLSTWWIINSTVFGAIAAIVLSSLYQAIVFWLIHVSRRRISFTFGNYAFILFWISFEYLHLDWDLSWTWLNLGNGFAKDIKIIQWYEYTGIFGGTLWVIVINLLLTKSIILLQKFGKFKAIILQTTATVLVITVPILISLSIFKNYEEKGIKNEVVVIQPNIDPYTEKFGSLSDIEQLDIILNLADSLCSESTNYIVAPETAIPSGIWLGSLNSTYVIKKIRKLLRKYPDTKFIIGASLFEKLDNTKELPASAREFRNRKGEYYNAYNSALQIDTSQTISIYHKSKLVPGVEKMPFRAIFKHIDNIAVSLGGITGTLGIQENRAVFPGAKESEKIAPVICYESIFGSYVSEYVRNGANMIFVITNDAWWGDTPGYRQHLRFSQIRAIETRCPVARSANTGISCFINQKGELQKPTRFWIKDAIKSEMVANNDVSFYTKHGDFIARVSLFIAALSLLYLFVQSKVKKSKPEA